MKENNFLSSLEIDAIIQENFSGNFAGEKVLVVVPDHTRTLPLPAFFKSITATLADTDQLDFLVALGTHPPLSEAGLNELVGITAEERSTRYKHIGIINHAWDNPDALVSVGRFEKDEIKALSGASWHTSLPEKIEIRINKIIYEYEHILILGPVFPHEVIGFSGGSKYLFPGISGPEITHATHWLGALATVVNTIGIKETPVRAMVDAAARKVTLPMTLIACVMDGHDLVDVFVGDLFKAWEQAVELSYRTNISWKQQLFSKVLSCPPPMYDELWTAAKAMYKIEPAVAQGGEVIVYAPHLDTVSLAHEKYIYEVGYHTLPYFLANWSRFKDYPLGVLAHSTHFRGSGKMENGVEIPHVDLYLASKISREDCEHLNLKYLDPHKIDVEAFMNKEDDGVLYVPDAGEKLYRHK